jgi:hypothetical protein
MVLNNVHPRYTILNTTAIVGGGELYLILVVAATARRLTGRSGYRSIGVDTILGGQEELGRMTEEKGATS